MSHTAFYNEILHHMPSLAGKLHVYETLESTNITAKAMAEKGAVSGTVIIAERQTGGRGRLGRRFHSAHGSGIYMSMILRPSQIGTDVLPITAMAAVCVAEAAEALGSAPLSIKWVNDVYKNGKKVCGILTEGVFSPDKQQIPHIILGIGVNVYTPEGGFHSEIESIADSIFSTCQAGLRSQLIAEILKRVDTYLAQLDTKPFLSAYRARDMLSGRNVQVFRGAESYPATVVGIGDDFSLHVCTADGTPIALTSGEVSIRF